MAKKRKTKKVKSDDADKPVSLDPLTVEEALEGLLKTKPEKPSKSGKDGR